jgi:hypothetical protein
MTARLRALASVLVAAPLLICSPAATAKPAPTGAVCGTVRLDTGYGGPEPAHLADVVRLAATDARGRSAGRLRYGAEVVHDTFRLLPYRIDGLPLHRKLTVAAALAGPLGSPPPATGFAWNGVLQPAAGAPRGPFALEPGPCRRVDYALQLVEVPPPPMPAPTSSP